MRVPAQIVANVEPAILVLKDAEGATPRNHDDFDAPRGRLALRLHSAEVAATRFGDGLRVTGRQRARMAGGMVGDSKRRDRREQDEPRDNGRCFHELECTGSRILLQLSLPDRSSRAPVICPPVPGATGRPYAREAHGTAPRIARFDHWRARGANFPAVTSSTCCPTRPFCAPSPLVFTAPALHLPRAASKPEPKQLRRKSRVDAIEHARVLVVVT